MRIQVQCGSCRGTGLYEGFAEPSGEPVVCLNCGGTGAEYLTFEPYTGRKTKRGVKKVRFSRGNMVALGVGGVVGSEMTYAEFKRRIPEAQVEG